MRTTSDGGFDNINDFFRNLALTSVTMGTQNLVSTGFSVYNYIITKVQVTQKQENRISSSNNTTV